MRVYIEETKKEKTLKEIYCNKCGRKIEVKKGIVREGVLSVEHKWDYFSQKDGIKHSFDICEECYDGMIKKFKYPVTSTEYSELL
jgi:hypothetical protein